MAVWFDVAYGFQRTVGRIIKKKIRGHASLQCVMYQKDG